MPDRTDPTNKADRFHYDYRNRLIKVEHSDDYGEGSPTSKNAYRQGRSKLADYTLS